MSLEKHTSALNILQQQQGDSSRISVVNSPFETETSVLRGEFFPEIPSISIPNTQVCEYHSIEYLDLPENNRSPSTCSSTYSALSDYFSNLAHPLLGSPNTCGFWSPLARKKSPTLSVDSEIHMSSSPVRLSHGFKVSGTIKLVQELQAVGERLDVLTDETKKMRKDTHKFASSLKRLVTRVDKLFRLASDFRRDLADVAYLEQTVKLLNGNLSGGHFNNWPFRILRPLTPEEFNLVI